jgi:hypothetical protein
MWPHSPPHRKAKKMLVCWTSRQTRLPQQKHSSHSPASQTRLKAWPCSHRARIHCHNINGNPTLPFRPPCQASSILQRRVRRQARGSATSARSSGKCTRKEGKTISCQHLRISCPSAQDTAAIHEPTSPAKSRGHMDLRVLRV